MRISAPGTARRQGRGPAHGLRLLHEVVLKRDQWNIGIIDAPIHRLLEPEFRPKVTWLSSPAPGTYRADPFGAEDGEGQSHLLCEHFDYRTYKGVLQGGVLGADGAFDAAPVLPSPVHCSYPYVFRHGDAVYCVPEMAHARKVMIYRAEQLPDRWVEAATILNGVAAVDPTIFRHDGLWWLFHTDRDRDRRADLFAWYAESLDGPWTRHARQPLKSDLGSARPAGTPFIHDGCLYRPAQDCSEGYGSRVVINRVTALSPDAFSEEPASFVEPEADDPYPDGIHTVSAMGEKTLVDGKRSGFIFWALAGTCRKRFAGLVGRQWPQGGGSDD